METSVWNFTLRNQCSLMKHTRTHKMILVGFFSPLEFVSHHQGEGSVDRAGDRVRKGHALGNE